MNYASAGVGAASHLAAEALPDRGRHHGAAHSVRGPTEALTEVMAGRIDFYFIVMAPALPLIDEARWWRSRSARRTAPARSPIYDHGRSRPEKTRRFISGRAVRAGQDAARDRPRG